MARRLTPAITLTASAAIVGLALSACGSSSLSTPSASSTPAVAAQSADPALVAMLPAKIKSAGQMVVGVDATYSPDEFLNADGKTVQGWDVDLFNAVMQKFGIKVTWQPAAFDSIITGVESGKFDAGVSSFSITPAREGQVNMVSYFSSGTGWAAAPGNPKKVDPLNPCGVNVAVQKGTVQEQTDMPPKVKKCAAAGKPLTLQIYAGQDQVSAAVVTGKADAMLADSQVTGYAIKQSGGKMEAVPPVYGTGPYGYVVPKADTQFATALASALKALNTSGTYKKVLTNWGVDAGAVSTFGVNPAVSP